MYFQSCELLANRCVRLYAYISVYLVPSSKPPLAASQVHDHIFDTFFVTKSRGDVKLASYFFCGKENASKIFLMFAHGHHSFPLSLSKIHDHYKET